RSTVGGFVRNEFEQSLNRLHFWAEEAQKCKRFKLCSNSFLTKPPTVLLAERQYKRVPLLVGMNSNDLHNSPSIIGSTTNDFHNKSETEKENFANWLLRVLEKIPNIRYSELSYHFPEIQQLYFNQSERDNGDLLISSSSLNNFLYEAVVVHGLWKFAMTYAYDKPVYPYIITFQGTTKSMFHDESENRAFPDGIEFLTPSLPNLHEFESGSDEELFSQHLVHLWATFATHQKPVDVWDDKQTWLPMSVAQLNGEKPVTWYGLDKHVQKISAPFMQRMKFWDKLFKKETGIDELIKVVTNEL
ncbi:Carboxylesterase 5A, partial [Orchesella cincta]